MPGLIVARIQQTELKMLPSLYFTAGVHPHDAKSCNVETLDALRALANQTACVAIGECGFLGANSGRACIVHSCSSDFQIFNGEFVCWGQNEVWTMTGCFHLGMSN